MRFIALAAIVLAAIVSCEAKKVKKFPESFLFGAAGSAYQNEGAYNEDGKGSSQWDIFAHTPGKISDNTTGDIACDSYHKYKEDTVLMKKLGLKAIRFSISWPRILPNGSAYYVNQAGINHYIKVLKDLKLAGIEPLVTLYHWDLPQYLSELGGWLNPRMVDYFGDYVRICFKYFGQYVKYWITLNEPVYACQFGYEQGAQPPGLILPGEGIYQCAYVQNLAHARAFHIYDKEFRKKQRGKVGLNLVGTWHYPATNSSKDIEAAKRAIQFMIGLFVDPIATGNWPKVPAERIANRSRLEGYSFSRLPPFSREQTRYMKGAYDFFSVNTYTSQVARYQTDYPIRRPSYSADWSVTTYTDPSWMESISDYFVGDPPGIRHVLNYIRKVYNSPEIIVAENGSPDYGGLDDDARITYLQGYLSNVLDAIVEDGVNVVGYFIWSFLDSFEWTSGYTWKFGLIDVDFDDVNRTRTFKKSAYWYQQVISSRTVV